MPVSRRFSLFRRAPHALLLLALLVPVVGMGQVPTFQDVTGHDFGDRITLHHEMVTYLETLAEASPRVQLLEQGTSWEGRRLVAAVVTAPSNMERLEEIRRGSATLADPRGSTASEIESLVSEQPIVVWYGGSIHGNELSGSEGLLKLLEHLTTRDDQATRGVLEDAVVLIDPMLNPDGRDAFARANLETGGRRVDPATEGWGNDWDGWHGIKFRTGHYFFDTNRDWFAQTQAETRARVPTMLAWHPQVAVDAHEMGRDVEFYFDPAAEPYGPFFPSYARQGFEIFNRAYAAAFDSAGFEYMTRERYNYFYPGYTTSYSSYQGSVGMLYEQGSSRGLAIERPDGSVRTLGEALEHQYVAARAAVRASVRERQRLLDDYVEGRRAAVEDGESGVRRYLLPPDDDPDRLSELVNTLRRNGIEVRRLTSDVRVESLRDREGRPAEARSFPAGTYVVEAAQPANRLVRALLEPDNPLPEAFLEEARARVDRDESPRFYDITAWSLPLLFDQVAFGTRAGQDLPTTAVTSVVRSAADPTPDRPGYAYLVDGGQTAAAAMLGHLANRGHRAGMLVEPTRIDGRDFAAGTVIVRVAQNDDSVHAAVSELAERYGLEVQGMDTGLAEPGHPSLGSGDVIPARSSRIGLVAETPVHGYSFGWTWWTLDRAYELPVTVLRVGALGGSALEDYDVLVLPDLFSASALADRLGEDGMDRLRGWIRDGGTLVTVGEGTEFARTELEMLDLRSWYDVAEEDAYRFDVPGAFIRGEVEDAWWLSAGLGEELPVLVASSRVLLPPEGPPSSDRRVVVSYGTGDDGEASLLSGHAWQESRARLPGAVFAYEQRQGGGRIVAFTEDPSFRGYWRGPDRLLLNAVVLGRTAP